VIRRGAIVSALIIIVSTLIIFTSPSEAKSQSELGWSMADVLSTAVRYVRVDRGCKVTERDDSSAYVLFECPGDDGKKVKPGALELYRVERGGRELVRAQLTLSDDPRYVEIRFLDLLERKLREERGPPAPPLRTAHPGHPDGGA
jgi:hypothetical protein